MFNENSGELRKNSDNGLFRLSEETLVKDESVLLDTIFDILQLSKENKTFR